MKPIISVIVPVYKVEQYLDTCVQSILDQSYSQLEIILVDDGSPDHCPEKCDRWALLDKRIKVIHKKNGGLSDARNAGLEICTGDYISFVDSDDYIRPEMYERMLYAIKEEDADICACSIIRCYSDKEVKGDVVSGVAGRSEEILDLLYSDSMFPVCAWNKLYRRELWKEIRFPVGKICEDAFTMYLLVHKAKWIVQIPEALYCYRIRPESIMTSSFSKKSMDEEEAWRKNYEFIKKQYPRLYKKTFTFYLQSVLVVIHKIKKEEIEQYHKEYDYLKKVLLENRFFMLFKSTASLKYRVRFLIDVAKL